VDELKADRMLEFAEQAGAGLDGLDRKALFAELEEQYDELLAAMQSFLDEGRFEGAIRLASALARFWTASGRLEEGAQWFDRVLAGSGNGDAIVGRAFFEAGLIAFWRGADDHASELEQRALEIGRRAGDATVTAQALTGLARIALRATNWTRRNGSAVRRSPSARGARLHLGVRGHYTFSALPLRWLAGSRRRANS
jgi:hypothetical protein